LFTRTGVEDPKVASSVPACREYIPRKSLLEIRVFIPNRVLSGETQPLGINSELTISCANIAVSCYLPLRDASPALFSCFDTLPLTYSPPSLAETLQSGSAAQERIRHRMDIPTGCYSLPLAYYTAWQRWHGPLFVTLIGLLGVYSWLLHGPIGLGGARFWLPLRHSFVLAWSVANFLM